MKFLILGCGYTGLRVARSLLTQGHDVTVTSRNPQRLDLPTATKLALDFSLPSAPQQLRDLLTEDHAVLHSLTPVAFEPSPALARARKVVYISTTGVYGPQRDVNESTQPQATTPREQARLAVEASLASSRELLILRPAAIYGPHRGIHASMREGKYKLLGRGANFVSRIHVDDLATHCVQALLSQVTGAWPVADDEPCESREIARFCATLLNLPMPESVDPRDLSETRRADRRVDGSAIRRELNLSLRFPSYRVGIPACVAAEARAF